MSVTAIIPARGGSKGIPRKNIITLGQHPLIAYTIAIAKMSSIIDEVVVSTDCPEIAEISSRYGADVPFLRPKEISQDNSKDIDFFCHYIDFCRDSGRELTEYLVHLRPITPLREVEILDAGVKSILSDSEASSMRSVYRTNFSPYKVFWMQDEYLEGFFPDDPRTEYHNLPHQQFPQTFIPNGYVDVVRVSTIDQGTLYGDNMLGFVTYKVPDIDTIDDFHEAQDLLCDGRFSPLMQYLEKYI